MQIRIVKFVLESVNMQVSKKLHRNEQVFNLSGPSDEEFNTSRDASKDEKYMQESRMNKPTGYRFMKDQQLMND